MFLVTFAAVAAYVSRFPVLKGKCILTSKPGPRNINVPGASKYHRGADLVSSNMSMQSPCDGTIAFNPSAGGCGNMVNISCVGGDKNGCKIKFCHLKSFNRQIKGSVKTGNVVGVMGKTGTATGVHLHIEIYCGGVNRTFGLANSPEAANRNICNAEKEPLRQVASTTSRVSSDTTGIR